MDDIWRVITEKQFLSNELWRWLALFGLLLGGLVVGRIATFFVRRQADRLKASGRVPLLAAFLDSLVGPAGILLLAGCLYLAGCFLQMEQTLTIGEGDQAKKVAKIVALVRISLWLKMCQTLAVVATGWFAFRLVSIIELLLRKLTSRTDTALDDQLVPLVRKTLRVFVVIVAALYIMQNVFGQQIGPLIAGLGIGGLAVALAAKDALANLFGSVTIFTDRPFHMGDRIKVAGQDGVVEEVGFRSTRLRTLAGHQVVVPNAVMSSESVENIGRRPFLKRILEIGVTYDTTPAKLARAMEIIKEMLDARSEQFAPDCPYRVWFSEFAASSLTIVVYYWFVPPDWAEYMQFNHEFNMELLERFNAEDIEFAFPTQTLHVKQD